MHVFESKTKQEIGLNRNCIKEFQFQIEMKVTNGIKIYKIKKGILLL